MENVEELIRKAFEAQKKAYTPYSHFQVGAALLCRDGSIYGGCIIENASYSPTNCAERTAFFRAIYDGKKDFDAIVIVGKREDSETFDICAPCGVCRQVMAEFCDPDGFTIILATDESHYERYSLRQLLPLGFTEKDMRPKGRVQI